MAIRKDTKATSSQGEGTEVPGGVQDQVPEEREEAAHVLLGVVVAVGKTAQWIIDARKAKKRAKMTDAIPLSNDPVKRRRQLKASLLSHSVKQRKRKHGRTVR